MKKLALLLATILILTSCSAKAPSTSAPSVDSTGSGTSADSSDLPDIEFSIFIPNPAFKAPPQDSPVMKQLYDKTHVRLKYIIPPAEPAERLNIMLASDDMPDLIRFDDAAIMKQYKEAGKLLKLNELLETHAPNAFNINWKDLKRKIADENGDYYFMPGAYFFGAARPEAGYAFNVRTDYFEQEGYDKAPKTLAEFAELLRQVKAKNPDISPLGLALGPLGQLMPVVYVGAAANGLTYNTEGLILTKDNQLQHYTASPEIKDFMKYLNGLNVEGLIDPESPIMSTEMLKQKCVAEQDWAYLADVWEIDWEVTAYEQSIGSNEVIVNLFPTRDETIKNGTYSPYASNVFSSGVTITHKNKDPERFMQFYEFINSEEGWLTALGIINTDFTGENTPETTEGYDYIIRKDKVTEDGKFYLDPTMWMSEQWAADENWYWNRGVNCLWDFTYGEGEMFPGSPYVYGDSMDVGMWWDENTTRINGELGWTGTNYFPKMAEMGVDKSEITGLIIEPSDAVYTKLLAVTQTHEKLLPRVIMASSAEGFETEWNNYVAELEKVGLGDVMKRYNELLQERLVQWGQAS